MSDCLQYLDEIEYLHHLLDEHQIPYRTPVWKQKQESAEETPAGMNIKSDVQLRPGLFHQYFKGRDDLYWLQGSSGQYYLPCENRFDPRCTKNDPQKSGLSSRSVCKSCPYKQRPPLSVNVLLDHLRGRQSVGISPIEEDGTVHFLVIDLEDLPEKSQQPGILAQMIRKTVQQAGFDCLCERTASGKGRRIWIFFEEAIPALKANEFGRVLLLKAASENQLFDFGVFDRIVPGTSSPDPSRPGKMVVLPLQGSAVSSQNSVFLDENGVSYPDQWQAIRQTSRTHPGSIQAWLRKMKTQGLMDLLDVGAKEKGAKSKKAESESPEMPTLFSSIEEDQSDPDSSSATKDTEPILIKLCGHLEIEAQSLPAALQGKIMLLGCYWNPALSRKGRPALPAVIQHSAYRQGKIFLPRHLLKDLEKLLESNGHSWMIEDHLQDGNPVEVRFTGTLSSDQKKLQDALLQKDSGILEAATGTGKTVIGASIVASCKTSALILVDSTSILKGWVDTLNRFLEFSDELNLNSKDYPGQIGVLQGSSDTLSGRVDVAMVSSLVRKENLSQLLGGYGLVLVDECHHAGAAGYQKVLDAIAARRVYGLSGTPRRTDGRSLSVWWQLGKIAASFTSKQQMAKQSFTRTIIPRMTRFLCEDPESGDFTRLLLEAADNPLRNQMIIEDIERVLGQGRTVLVLTRFVDHARKLAQTLEQPDREVLVFAGDPKEKRDSLKRLKTLDPDRPAVLVGTVQSVGEGFDFPRLDTLMVSLPMKSEIVVSQAVGRIHRQSQGKTEAIVYDYADIHVPMFERMYRSRLKEYKKQGYDMRAADGDDGESSAEIFSAADYLEKYRHDLAQTEKNIVFSSRTIDIRQAEQMKSLFASAVSRKVRVDVFAEKSDEEALELLRSSGMHVHLFERIIGRWIVLDGKIVWYGGIQDESGEEGILRMESEQSAQDLLGVRREQLRQQMSAGRQIG